MTEEGRGQGPESNQRSAGNDCSPGTEVPTSASLHFSFLFVTPHTHPLRHVGQWVQGPSLLLFHLSVLSPPIQRVARHVKQRCNCCACEQFISMTSDRLRRNALGVNYECIMAWWFHMFQRSHVRCPYFLLFFVHRVSVNQNTAICFKKAVTFTSFSKENSGELYKEISHKLKFNLKAPYDRFYYPPLYIFRSLCFYPRLQWGINIQKTL